jgi:hypothetical protein
MKNIFNPDFDTSIIPQDIREMAGKSLFPRSIFLFFPTFLLFFVLAMKLQLMVDSRAFYHLSLREQFASTFVMLIVVIVAWCAVIGALVLPGLYGRNRKKIVKRYLERLLEKQNGLVEKLGGFQPQYDWKTLNLEQQKKLLISSFSQFSEQEKADHVDKFLDLLNEKNIPFQEIPSLFFEKEYRVDFLFWFQEKVVLYADLVQRLS